MAAASRRNRVLRKLIANGNSDSEHQRELSDTEQPSVADILRRRLQQNKRKHGLAFSSSTQPRPSEQSEEVKDLKGGDGPAEEAGNASSSVYSKFTAQTGVRVDAHDKQLEEYIDARMKQMMYASQAERPANTSFDTPTRAEPGTQEHAVKLRRKEADRQYAPQEVDLPPPRSGQTAAGQLRPNAPPKKDPRIRIGRNGKPYIPRRFRNGPTEADIQRDRAVEAVLRENAPGGIAGPAEPVVADQEAGGGDNADERLAEAFRQEYLAEAEAVRKREREREIERAKDRSGKKAKVDDALKGPKLGGSRSARLKYMEEHAAKK